MAPCTDWITEEDVADCCGLVDGTDLSAYEPWLTAASEIMYLASGAQFPGVCEAEGRRPCASTSCGCWAGYEHWPQETVWNWDLDRWACGPRSCGCAPVSEIKLAGYPIREITEVKIDGVIVDPGEYRLDYDRYLVRTRDTAEPTVRRSWPGCQIIDLPDTEAGTFSVSYTYGADPPAAGVMAAAKLACEMFRACDSDGGECALPSNVTQVVRQGITETMMLASAIREGKTGILVIDAFVTQFNPTGRSRRGATMSPDLDDFPRRVG